MLGVLLSQHHQMQCLHVGHAFPDRCRGSALLPVPPVREQLSSEGMLGNVLWALLRLCEPFLSVGDPKAEALASKTDLDYFRGSDRYANKAVFCPVLFVLVFLVCLSVCLWAVGGDPWVKKNALLAARQGVFGPQAM